MSWSNKYIGIPQMDMGRSEQGCDCWGLVRLVYARELNIPLPDYLGTYVSPEEQAEIAALIDQAEANPARPWQAVDHPAPFDVLLFRRGRLRSHIGVAVSPSLMLHMDGTDQARLARFTAPRWSVRFCGAWRYRPLGPLEVAP